MTAQSTEESGHRDKLRKLYRMWQKGMVDEAAYIAALNDFYALRAENRSAAKLQKGQTS